jgi:hypothetical protein
MVLGYLLCPDFGAKRQNPGALWATRIKSTALPKAKIADRVSPVNQNMAS